MFNSTRRGLLIGSAASLSLMTLGSARARAPGPVRFLDIYLYRHRMVPSGALESTYHVAEAAIARSGMSRRARLIRINHHIGPRDLVAQASIAGGRFGLGNGGGRPSGMAAMVERVRQGADPRERPYAYVIVPQDIGPEIYIRSAALMAEPDNPYRALLIRSTGDPSDPLARGFSPDPRDEFVDDIRRHAPFPPAGQATMLDAARLLLNHPYQGAEYVFVASPGYRNESAADHISRAIGSVCRQCLPGGFDLDQTVIVIHADIETPTEDTPARGLSVMLGSEIGSTEPELPSHRSVATRSDGPLTDRA